MHFSILKFRWSNIGEKSSFFVHVVTFNGKNGLFRQPRVKKFSFSSRFESYFSLRQELITDISFGF